MAVKMKVDVWHDEEIPAGQWVFVAAQMACGCYARCEAYTEAEGFTARQAVNQVGGFVSNDGDEPVTMQARGSDKVSVILPGHDREHAAKCRAQLAEEFVLRIDVIETFDEEWPGPC